MDREVDILGVGLGPTGATLSALLARLGLRMAVSDVWRPHCNGD